MRASLIIAVYKNVPFLKAVLDSCKLQTIKDFEIIIAEDGQSAEMSAFIASYHFENSWQHLTQEDFGWRKNKAMNMAIRAAKTDWLIFIDGDCVLHPRFVEMHLRYANEKNILAGKRVMLDVVQSNKLLQNIEYLHKLRKSMIGRLLTGKGGMKFIEEGIYLSPTGFWSFVTRLRTLYNLKGCNMSFSRKAIEAINGFDEDYELPAIGEDFDLTWRFASAGYQFKSLRNLAVQFHLYHEEIWSDTTENMKICNSKRNINKYICDNGLKRNN